MIYLKYWTVIIIQSMISNCILFNFFYASISVDYCDGKSATCCYENVIRVLSVGDIRHIPVLYISQFNNISKMNICTRYKMVVIVVMALCALTCGQWCCLPDYMHGMMDSVATQTTDNVIYNSQVSVTKHNPFVVFEKCTALKVLYLVIFWAEYYIWSYKMIIKLTATSIA